MEELGKTETGLNFSQSHWIIEKDEPMSKVIIDLDAYRHNLKVVRNLVGSYVRIIAVVKANAYGHGIVPVAQCAEKWGINMVAVANVEEGVVLRQNGIKIPILVLLQPQDDDLLALIDYQLTPLVSELEIVKRLSELATRAKVNIPIHCKIDTGMGRQGFSMDTVVKEVKSIVHLPHIDVEGVATHFPCADVENDAFTMNQIRVFSKLLNDLERDGVPYEFAHSANSPAIINYPKSYFDAVRPGLMTYGLWPVKKKMARSILKPVLRWETRVTQVRSIKAGTAIGYGRTFIANQDMDIAVLPVGYADGYRTQLSNKGEVLIHGTRCPVRGSVSMDQIVVEIKTKKPVSRGDTAVLIGKDGNEEIHTEELAEKAGTIVYDILTGIGPRVTRTYINKESEGNGENS